MNVSAEGAGTGVLTQSQVMDQKSRLKARWKGNKALFQKQLLKYPLVPFQRNMLEHKGELHLGRNIAMRLLPRDSGKSWAGTIGDCIYEVCEDPDIATQIIAEAVETSIMFLTEVKSQFEENNDLIYFYGEHRDPDKTWAMKKIVSKQRQVIRKEPTVEALGAGGATVGRHVKIQWCDDIVSDRTSSTQDKRAKLEQWYDKTAFPVLEQGGFQRINGTRWYPSDLYDYLLKKYGTGILYKVPALTEIVVGDYSEPQNGDCMEFRRVNGVTESIGSVLRTYFYQRYSALTLSQLRKANPATFASQYQNDITLLASQFINADAIQIISQSEWPDFRELTFFIGVDPAVKQKSTADYFATTTIGYNDELGKIYIFRSTQQRLGDANSMMEHILNEWLWVVRQGGDVVEVAIEDNIFQALLSQSMQADPQRFGLIPIVGVTNLKDKVQRLVAVAHYFNLEKVLIDEDCQALITELMQFPNAPHDDMVDSMMNALQSLNSSAFGGLSLPLNIFDIAQAGGAVMSF